MIHLGNNNTGGPVLRLLCLQLVGDNGIYWWARPNTLTHGKCSSHSNKQLHCKPGCVSVAYSITQKALCCRACAVYVFPSMCRRITCRETVDRHVCAVAKLWATFYYLPPVVAALCFDSCLFFFSRTCLPKNERKRWHRSRQRCMWFSFLWK